LTAARDDELVGAGALLHAQADVGLQLAVESGAELARGTPLAFAAGEGAGADAKGHLQRRLVNLDARQLLWMLGIGPRFADVRLGDAGQRYDAARRRLLNLRAT